MRIFIRYYICINLAQRRWIKASQTLLKDLMDPFIVCDKCHYNCLEVAIINYNRSFINYIFDLKKCQWEMLMQNAQINDKGTHVDTPMRKMIRYMPDIACKVFDKCIEINPDKNDQLKEKKKKRFYDFQFVEDHCHVQEWDRSLNNKSKQNGMKLIFFLKIILFICKR